MRNFWVVAILVGAMFVLGGSLSFSSRADNSLVKGDYVEVRTASVFAGACHYNGEITTAGRDALMAWNFRSGAWRGIDLAGVRVVAIVSGDANLANNNAARRAAIIIGENASDAQSRAIVEALKTRYATSLGKIISVRRGPLAFEHNDKSYTVTADDSASINIEAMPDDLCCKMPQLVWYSPLVPLENRKVGYTTKAISGGAGDGEPWQTTGENSAFYGSFTL